MFEPRDQTTKSLIGFHRSEAKEVREQRMLKLQSDAVNAPWSRDMNDKQIPQKMPRNWAFTGKMGLQSAIFMKLEFHTHTKHGKEWTEWTFDPIFAFFGNAPSLKDCHPSTWIFLGFAMSCFPWLPPPKMSTFHIPRVKRLMVLRCEYPAPATFFWGVPTGNQA